MYKEEGLYWLETTLGLTIGKTKTTAVREKANQRQVGVATGQRWAGDGEELSLKLFEEV